MMKFLLVIAMLILGGIHYANAQAPSLQKPIEDPNAPISKTIINDMYNQCRVTPINRFTPDALESYCACTAAATQGTFRMGEFLELQKSQNQKLGNKIFETYVTKVITPCLQDPVDEIEYYHCVLDRTNDPRIYNIPRFCTCMSKKLAKHVKDFGASNMMLSIGAAQRVIKPIDALWMSRDFSSARRNARDECLGSYLK